MESHVFLPTYSWALTSRRLLHTTLAASEPRDPGTHSTLLGTLAHVWAGLTRVLSTIRPPRRGSVELVLYAPGKVVVTAPTCPKIPGFCTLRLRFSHWSAHYEPENAVTARE